MTTAQFVVEMKGGHLRAGELEQIKRQLKEAAQQIEPLMDINVQVFWSLDGPVPVYKGDDYRG